MNSNKIYRNTAILTSLRFLEPAISMLVVMTISRFLGPKIFGSYAVLATVVNVAVVIAQMGLTTLLIREVARRPAQAASLLKWGLLLSISSSMVVIAGFLSIQSILNLPREMARLAPLAGLGVVPLVAISCYEAVFTGFERMELVMLRSLSAGAIRAALMVGTVMLGGDLYHIILVDLFTGLISVGLCFGVFKKLNAPLQQSLSRNEIGDLFRTTLPFYGMSLIATLSTRVDVFMLTRYAQVTDVGYYVAGFKLFELAMVVPVSYIRASFPQLSSTAHQSPDRLSLFVKRLQQDAWIYVTGVGALLIGVGGIAVGLIYGHKYDVSWRVLEILALAMFPSVLSRIYSISLISLDLQKFELFTGGVMILVNVGLQRWLIPLHGVLGSAVATLSAWLVGSCLFMGFVRLRLGRGIIQGWPLAYLGSGFLLALLVSFTEPMGIARVVACGALVLPLLWKWSRKLSSRRKPSQDDLPIADCHNQPHS